MDSHDVVSEHRAAGRRFEAAGISSFVREAGPPGGEPVVCLHGVPASCFLYRKVLRELAARGLRGIAFDLPGLGLADRRATFDYRNQPVEPGAVIRIDDEAALMFTRLVQMTGRSPEPAQSTPLTHRVTHARATTRAAARLTRLRTELDYIHARRADS